MTNFLQTISNFFRGVALFIIASLAAVGSWFGYDTYTHSARVEEQLKQSTAELAKNKVEIEKLGADIAAKAQEIERLDLALRLLKVDHRVAEIAVLDQWQSEVEKRLKTKFEFRDVDDKGAMLDAAPKVFTIDGDVVYIDAWVVKYNDELIEKGDPLRSTSVCLFRRVFGEFQQPAEGFKLDQVTTRPVAYGTSGDMTDYEKQLWTHFWDYANNSDEAKKAGVRAAHGEAPSIKLQRGKLYKLLLRSSGGLTIETQDLPPDRAGSL
jgi:cell division protein FtsB